jgi:hypothetical protein
MELIKFYSVYDKCRSNNHKDIEILFSLFNACLWSLLMRTNVESCILNWFSLKA